MTGPAPLRIVVSALGGEGGGVLMNWIVEAARLAGRAVQATSVPGVAQRTGSTSYYIEIADGTKGRAPVLSLMPMPGRVDVVLASELVEAARALEAGLVSPRLTTLITSSSRVYSTAEKIDLGDGRFDADAIRQTAGEMARQCLLLDLDALARDNGTFISATMFGALVGSGVLPWPDDISRAVLGSGKSAKASLRGFDAARDAAVAVLAGSDDGAQADTTAGQRALSLPQGSNFATAPAEVQQVIGLGHDRVCNFQDAAYGQLFLDRTNQLLRMADLNNLDTVHALQEASRRLALWMAYEDVARVADLKTRRDRFDTIKAEADLKPGQILKITDYLKPRAEEIADVMPAGLGRWIMRRVETGRGLPFLERGIHLHTTGVFGFYLLRSLASLKHIRKRSLRYGQEQRSIEVWLETLQTALATDPKFASALAELPRVLKGYSDTQARGKRAYAAIMATLVTPALVENRMAKAAAPLRQAIAAALADDKHTSLDKVLKIPDVPGPPPTNGATHVH